MNQGHPETYFLAGPFSGTLVLGGHELEEQSAENIFQLEWARVNEMINLPLKPEFVKKKILEEFGGRYSDLHRRR